MSQDRVQYSLADMRSDLRLLWLSGATESETLGFLEKKYSRSVRYDAKIHRSPLGNVIRNYMNSMNRGITHVYTTGTDHEVSARLDVRGRS